MPRIFLLRPVFILTVATYHLHPTNQVQQRQDVYIPGITLGRNLGLHPRNLHRPPKPQPRTTPKTRKRPSPPPQPISPSHHTRRLNPLDAPHPQTHPKSNPPPPRPPLPPPRRPNPLLPLNPALRPPPRRRKRPQRLPNNLVRLNPPPALRNLPPRRPAPSRTLPIPRQELHLSAHEAGST
ncbi:hypothetical protein CSAL01_06968 [Colletotrichum salicis]|uniref:Uncharacterized protein n=1 Tax=Colletotrichum salicis TaxID=1209931 RepID=A0A135VAE4_9PEZI|nr:hypothetical protein CSAL01_06968 [Colletotrichum salicis]